MIDLGAYKLCLKINLISYSTVRIKLVQVDDRILTRTRLDGQNYHVFRDDINNYRIWSYGKFTFSESHFRFPDSDNIDDETFYTYRFTTDKQRMEALRTLYKSLQLWASDRVIFKHDASAKNEINVSISDEYWFVY